MVQRSASARRASTKPAPARPEGIIRAIVAVTGVEDEVDDIITPGIFARTLAKRRPKVVFHHDFKDFAGRILHIEEWLPGDKRLPAKQPNGQPWPAAAGALVATMQFNMAVPRGREVYEWAKFYAESGEASWSIGYTVPRGMSAKRGDTRIIYGIDLFEVSLVLHGAHPMTMALEVKSAAALLAGARTLETKATPANQVPYKDAEGEHTGIMVALHPSREVAAGLAVEGGEPVDELHVTLAYLGDKGDAKFTADDVVAAVRSVAGAGEPLSGQVGGIGVFPDTGHGAPVWVPVDVPGLETLRERIVAALDEGPTAGAVRRDHGYTPHMTLGYDLPKVSPVAPTPVSFDQVSVVFGGERTDVPLGNPAPTTPPGIEVKAGAALVDAARLTAKMETKAMATMPGSFEERTRLIEAQVRKEMTPKKDGKKHDGPQSCGWVSIDATFDTHVVVSVFADENPGPDTFDVAYTIAGDKVTLGKRTPVDLELVAVPDGQKAEPVDEAVALVVAPTISRIEQVTSTLSDAPLEFKALQRVRPAVMALLDALSEKGMDVGDLLYGEPDEDPADEPDEDDDEDQPFGADPEVETKTGLPEDEDDAEADERAAAEPAAPATPDGDDEPPAEPTDEGDDEGERVSIDKEEVERELAALRA